MLEADALMTVSALGQATRLRIVVMLAEVGDVGMSSGAMADRVGVPRNLMSSHLAILGRAGLVASSKRGRSVVYVARRDRLLDLCAFLADVAA